MAPDSHNLLFHGKTGPQTWHTTGVAVSIKNVSYKQKASFNSAITNSKHPVDIFNQLF